MPCTYHPDKSPVAVCLECGEPICEQCNVDISGRSVCKSCVSAKAASQSAPPPPPKPVSPSWSYMAAPTPPPAPASPPVKPIRVSGFLTFCFSMMPGAGHMYLGFMKKGMLLMSLFMGSAACVGMGFVNLEPLFGIVCCLIWFWSFFDALQLKRKLRAGIVVEDDISEFTSFVSRNKSLIICAATVLVILALFNTAFYGIYREFKYVIAPHIMNSRYFGHLISSAAIIFGIVFICKTLFRRNRP